jgi:hypothetical protein
MEITLKVAKNGYVIWVYNPNEEEKSKTFYACKTYVFPKLLEALTFIEQYVYDNRGE